MKDHSFALGHSENAALSMAERFSLFLVVAGVVLGLMPLGAPWLGSWPLVAGISMVTAGGLWYFYLRFWQKPHLANVGVWSQGQTSKGWSAWVVALLLTGFYVLLYWFPWVLDGLIRTTDGLSFWLRNKPADNWFLYGTFYTFAVLLMGVRALLKYRHSRYQLIRTCSVMFFQLVFAYLLPHLMVMFQQPEFYFSYFWPLKYEYLWPDSVASLAQQPGGVGVFLIFWSVTLSFLATPVLTYFYGKRWYCSWVCGCGGLAETAGDPYRHLADRSRKAWRWEVRLVYSILAAIILITILLWANSFLKGAILGHLSGSFAQWYGFFIGSIFAGVIGVGFYPLLGSRVWCRFGCPMAAYLGLLQKHFSRFRITTNGGQCISCGNCSTFCEMGIDVRHYAQKGEPIIRAACVGCGMCATVCPRGVLKLENGPTQGRYDASQLIHPDNLRILS
ncbi:4Fe-4S dicluster domain-containing protein [Rufibacter sp. LB8]|uniref:4Fe-4S binding protein n=1 Tax=Rufibacter sp. LB8 TaxID=2777781 RepID=UPI001CEFB0BB|nr:4Fe-4S dicluster domain-containing protein [Rufibacter sp. LB8]